MKIGLPIPKHNGDVIPIQLWNDLYLRVTTGQWLFVVLAMYDQTSKKPSFRITVVVVLLAIFVKVR